MAADGGVNTIVLDARDALEAEGLAERQGYAVLSVRAGATWNPLARSAKSTFPLMLFSQELLALLESGISVVEAIETLGEKEGRLPVRTALHGILVRLREGQPLSGALEEMPQAFPPLYVASIRASEKTSDLPEALRRFIAYQGQIESLRGKLISAAVYPALLIGIGGLVILFLMGYVVPRFSRIYEDVHGDLPWLSKVMMQWGQLVSHYGLPAGILALALGYGALRLLQRPATRERIGAWVWRLPTIGERLRVFHLSRCYRTIGMLLRGGMPMANALGMVEELLTPSLRLRLRQATERIREGIPASRAMEENGLATPVALRLLRVGEQTGNMGEMMERIAAFHDEETARWIDMATRLFGPILMMGIGVMIGGIVVLLYLPIFQIAESIG